MNNDNDVFIPPALLAEEAKFFLTMAGNFYVTINATVEAILKKAESKRDLEETLEYIGELAYITTARVHLALSRLHKQKQGPEP